ncbi:hypothetical protein T439DRAFT_320977 [Meredithblackwellia eburnea MCA 4105]
MARAGPSQLQLQLPPATSELLHGLRDAQSKIFPVNSPSFNMRPATVEADSEEGKAVLAHKADFIRTVLGGWMSNIAAEENRSGVHATTTTTESISILSSSIDGPQQYIKANPACLLFKPKYPSSPSKSGLPAALSTLPIPPGSAGFPDEDLATYLLPRILRTIASLEAALLSTEKPRDDATDQQSVLWRDRRDLRNKLQDLQVSIVRALAESAVRIEWRGRKDASVSGGLGKAREMMNELIKVVRILSPVSASAQPPYPFDIPLLGVATSKGVPDSDDTSLSSGLLLPVRSAIQSRAIVLSSLRVLHTLSATIPFLFEYESLSINLLVETWPAAPPQASVKGKERADETYSRVLHATIDLASQFINNSPPSFLPSIFTMLSPLVSKEVKGLFKKTEWPQRVDAMATDDLDTPDATSGIAHGIVRIVAEMWKIIMNDGDLSDTRAKLRQTFGSLVIEVGDQLVFRLKSYETPAPLRLLAVFLLAFPLYTRAPRSGLSSHHPEVPTAATELLSSSQLNSLGILLRESPTLSFDLPPSLAQFDHIAEAAWEFLSTGVALVVQLEEGAKLSKKRKRDRAIGDVGLPSSDGADVAGPASTAAKRQKSGWMDAVATVLKRLRPPEVLDLDKEPLEKQMARLLKMVPEQMDPNIQVQIFDAVGLLACARDGCLSFAPSTHDQNLSDHPFCRYCDSWTSVSAPSDITSPRTFKPKRPLQRLSDIAHWVVEGGNENSSSTLSFFKLLARLLNHVKLHDIDFNSSENVGLFQAVFKGMEAESRAVRLSAGIAFLAIIQTHAETEMSSNFVAKLCQQLDHCLAHSQPSVVSTTVITMGRLARVATPQGVLECKCLERLVGLLGHPNSFLKSLVRTELEQLAVFREIKVYALVQPHFAVIAPLLLGSKSNSSTLSAALDCFHQPRDTLLRMTREHTVPSLILNDHSAVLQQIADASKLSVQHMLLEPPVADAILAYLYMRPDSERDHGLAVLMREVRGSGGGDSVTLPKLIDSFRVPLVYRLVLELGDEHSRTTAQHALQEVERRRRKTTNPIDLAIVMKENIVGILSHMNRGLNETSTHRPTHEKQRIIRSLQAVTQQVGPAIAGFSPQIMATLQSALDTDSLRDVTLEAFRVFITTLKFNEIGPFIGPTSATFVRLWPELSEAGRATAKSTLEYIILKNSDNLRNFVQDIADLGGIDELGKANRRLQEMRQQWSFAQRSDFLLSRIGSENEVVALQALRELRVLMTSSASHLQSLATGDTFDRSIGPIIKALLGASAKDGTENEESRNIAFECIGVLGALDPDRFEMSPAEAPFIVAHDFNDNEESVQFALHLIQDLLIGAYRSTNDTRHQEFLAFAIQELLRFCGFTPELVNSSSNSSRGNDSVIRRRWNALPKWVLETCGPLLGASFGFKERSTQSPATYPIYEHNFSYRDWIRTWANDLMGKLKSDTAKRIFSAFPPILHLEDVAVAQHLLPHLVLSALISGSDEDRNRVHQEINSVLADQISSSRQRHSENSRMLSAQTIFGLMDHLSRWMTHARKANQDASQTKKSKSRTSAQHENWWTAALIPVESAIRDVQYTLVGQAALTCKSYARSLLNFEAHIVERRASNNTSNAELQMYFENLHECYANLDEPDGMEGISTNIIAPSILHQIREHESTGRWTSAQSCWEVKLQQTPGDPANHLGLLRCLRNLGHYDSMRTHIVGILHSRQGEEVEWARILAPFTIEASLIVGDWQSLEDSLTIPDIEGPEVSFGRVIQAIRIGDSELVTRAFRSAREELGGPIVAAGRESYRRVYDSIVHLHILHELYLIHHDSLSDKASSAANVEKLASLLESRLDSTSPSFRAREPILNMRRTGFKLFPAQGGKEQIGRLWLETSKIARKAGHSQTAYSAILQARDLRTDFTYLQSAKLLKSNDQTYRAIQEIENALPRDIVSSTSSQHKGAQVASPTPLAKAYLRRARWLGETGRLEHNDQVNAFTVATTIAESWESPFYYLGHYYDQWDQADQTEDGNNEYTKKSGVLHQRHLTCQNFSHALRRGTKYIYQAMPRMLTIWLEMGESPDVMRVYKERKNNNEGRALDALDTTRLKVFGSINIMMRSNLKRLPTYQWLTVLPQLVSRVLHPNGELFGTLEKILIQVLVSYPHQGFWAIASGAKSQTTRRARKNQRIITQAQEQNSEHAHIYMEGSNLVDQLLALCNHSIRSTETLAMEKTFPSLYRLAPSSLIIPLQSSLTVSLPANATHASTHKPFPDNLPVFHKFDSEILIMASLQKPRKISVFAEDGSKHSFLCKPKDDLRKDARLMEFNSMIIKLLKKDGDARNRRLTIRTYSVVPLNEECGLIEWVPHVVVLRGILNKLYSARNKAGWSPILKKVFDTIRDNPATIGERFEKEVLVEYAPPVFHQWFLDAFPEPAAWLRARLAYSRTAAVISMVGFVLGLGDRHCENILLDGTTGDTVHVDFNCLFDRGRTFEVAEQVPFRLTHNIIDGMGVTGVEGVFRKAAEVSLKILRDNKDSLMSVLETFLHDPLVEWSKKESSNRDAATSHIQMVAKKNLDPIKNKLRGLQVTSDPASLGEKEVSVGEQVERLIREARNPRNLGSMYVGWCAWF